MNRGIVAFFLVMSFWVSAAYSQKDSKATPGLRKADKSFGKTQPNAESLELLLERRLAESRLEAIGERAKALDNGILKVKILAKAGDGLWERNEVRARQLFTLAFQAIDLIKLDAKQDQRVAIAERSGGTSGPLFHLRSFVLQLIARRDLALAEDMRKSWEKEADKNDGLKNNPLNQEEKTEINRDIAVALARTQPEQSAQLIRGFLRNGIDEPLIFTLLRIRGDNSQLGDQLFREALESASLHQMLPNELASLAVYVLPSEADKFFGNDLLSDEARIQLIRRFLDYVFTGSRQLVTANNFSLPAGKGIDTELAERAYYTLKNLLPLFDRVQPQRTASISDQMRGLLAFMNPQDADVAEPAYHDSVDDLLKQAESTAGERPRTIAFMRASAAALNQGDVEGAVAIAARIDDLYERKIQTSVVLYQAAMRQLREDKLERAYQYARGIEFLPQRVAIFHRMAQKLWNDKTPEQARVTLDDIWDWLVKADNGPQKADAMLKITATMAQHDKERGFELLQATVKTLNGTDFSFKPPDRNRISVELHIAPDMLDFESSLTALAGNDSERAQTIAGSLTKPEMSLLAQAIVCQQVLAPR